MTELDNVVSLFSKSGTESCKGPSLVKKEAICKKIETPTYDRLVFEADCLDKLSKYPCEFDYEVYKKLEFRFADNPMRDGIVKSNPMKLVNSHHTCQQCLYALEVDTYGRDCFHNCLHCYAKAELTNPMPVPIDINEVRKIFYTVFETNKQSKWRSLLEKKTPLRIGCMSDSFMWIDHKYKVSQELLKLLKFYDYPYVILTRSDLIAHDDYISFLDPQLGTVQISISSTNDKMVRLIEPGTPSAKRRLRAIRRLVDAGFWTAVRINPILPIYPDGYFTDPDFSWEGQVPKFDFSSFEMVDEIAESGTKSIITGFGRLSTFTINNIFNATGIDLKTFFDRETMRKSGRDWHYSDAEIRYYYEEYKRRCDKLGFKKTVFDIGKGENHLWERQYL